jgi:hypothetical protein
VLGTFNSKDVLSANTVTAVYTLVDGANGELASNYSLANDSLASTITAKSLSISAPSIASKVYNGNATAGSLTLGTLSGFVGSETVTASGAAADYSSANVGTYNGVAVSYTLSNGSNGGLASNYSLAAGSATGVITAKGLSIAVPAEPRHHEVDVCRVGPFRHALVQVPVKLPLVNHNHLIGTSLHLRRDIRYLQNTESIIGINVM